MAFSGNQRTRHGLYGGARGPYGSFAGRASVLDLDPEQCVTSNQIPQATTANQIPQACTANLSAQAVTINGGCDV